MDPSSDVYNTTVFSYQAPPSVPSRYDHATGETLTSNESDSGDLNRTFVILIKIFGVVDILFICIYLGLFDYLFVISWPSKEKKRYAHQGLRGQNYDIYEHVEMMFP